MFITRRRWQCMAKKRREKARKNSALEHTMHARTSHQPKSVVVAVSSRYTAQRWIKKNVSLNACADLRRFLGLMVIKFLRRPRDMKIFSTTFVFGEGCKCFLKQIVRSNRSNDGSKLHEYRRLKFDYRLKLEKNFNNFMWIVSKFYYNII